MSTSRASFMSLWRYALMTSNTHSSRLSKLARVTRSLKDDALLGKEV